MDFMTPFYPLAIGDQEWMNTYGIPLLALIGLIIVSLYVWSYLAKRFEVMQSHEGDYFDLEVINFLRRMVQVLLLLINAVYGFYVVSLFLGWTSDPNWLVVMTNVERVALIIVIFLVAMLLVRILRRMARRARIRTTTEKALPSALEFTGLFLSYLIYVLAAVIIMLIILSAFPEINISESIGSFFSNPNNQTEIGVTIAIVIAIYFIVKLVETVLEDFKFRSKKFNPQVIELIETGVKYALFIIAILTVVFSLFVMINQRDIGLILIVVTLIFLVIGILLSYSTVQNIVSGLALMDTSPFDIGDRISITNGMVCDVIEKGLVFTKVKTLEGEVVDVPNSEIIEERIYNYSRSAVHGVSVFIEISYSIPFEEVLKTARTAFQEIDGILKEPKPEVLALETAGKNIRYEIIVYTKEVHRDREVRSDVISKIQEIFAAEGRKTVYD